MIAAIYARKSTEQNVSNDAKSVARQVDHARAYAARKGWTVADEHIYTDDGVSGAEFVKRPGLLRLMNAIERPAFRVLIMSEESRLGRESIETGWTVKKIVDAGVRVFYYLEDRERTLDSALEKVMMHLSTFAAEMEREKARQRTRDAMQRKASRGHVAGGKVYGYRNERRGDHVERVIVEPEAAIVRRIFQEIADGRGFARIAQGLNRDGIPAPRRKWAMTGVREMVFRDLYRGQIVYGKTRRIDKGGSTKKRHDRPAAEWLTLDAPDLRIVSAELWRAAHDRLERTRQTYLRQTGGKLYGRPEAGIEARHLFSGFLVCGQCGGGMHAIRRTSRRGQPRIYFLCNSWRVDGACDNAMSARLSDVDEVLIEAIRRDVLAVDVVEDVVRRAIELYTSEPDVAEVRRHRLAGERERLKGELARYAEAIAASGPLPSILDALKAREARLADVNAQLEHLDGLQRAALPWGDDLRGELRARLADWQGLVGRQPVVARQILRKLIVGRLTMTPKVTAKGRWYEISGQASYGALLTAVVGLVPPG
jgi:site-specific DNA recombinase